MNQPDLDSSVPDWLIEYPQLLRVFEQLKIDYCCGGKSLEFACRERGLDPGEVMAHLEAILRLPDETDRPAQ